jgi:predicted transposase YdaD
MHIRLLEYDIAIKAQHIKQGHKKLPEVLKIVLYTGKRDPRMPANIKNDLKKHKLETCLFCSALFIILQEEDDNHIKQREHGAALAELLLKYGGTKNFKQHFNHNKDAIFELMHRSNYSDEAFFYIWDQSGIPLKELLDKLTPDTKQKIMSGLQQMRQQSMEQGIQQGRQEGRQEGMERGMEKGIQHEKQEVVRTLTRFAEKGIISQEAMQTILSKI